MTNRVILAPVAAIFAIGIAAIMLLGVNWASEAITPLLVQVHRIPHAQSIGVVVSSVMGTVGAMVAIFAGTRRKQAPEEPLRPRIRNGRIG
jgi:hypothetical protein